MRLPLVLAPWLVGALVAGASLAFAETACAAEEEAIASPAEAVPAKEGEPGTDAEPLKGEDAAGGWGVGGKEDAGKFTPHGKTGKLKELEDAEEERRVVDETPVNLGPPGTALMDVVVAPSGSIIVPVQDSGPTKVAPGGSFIFGTSYRVNDKWEFGARFGLSTAATNGPREALLVGSRDPDSFKQVATGNLEVSFRPIVKLTRALVMPVGLALVFPTAMGDMFSDPDTRVNVARSNVNQAASAMRGWEDKALFEPHRFSLVPGARLIYQRPMGSGTGQGVLVLEARTKFEIMALTGGKQPQTVEQAPAGATIGDLKDVALNWVLGGGADYVMLDGLVTPGLKAWLAYATATNSFGSIDVSGAQFVLEPGVATNVPFSKGGTLRFQGRLSGILPLGGPLGSGNQAIPAGIAGLRIAAGLAF